MRKTMFVSTLLLTAAAAGCGGTAGPVMVTPETEAEQRQNEKQVRDAESARQKQQKPPKSREQEVHDAESARQRQGGR